MWPIPSVVSIRAERERDAARDLAARGVADEARRAPRGVGAGVATGAGGVDDQFKGVARLRGIASVIGGGSGEAVATLAELRGRGVAPMAAVIRNGSTQFAATIEDGHRAVRLGGTG